MPFLRFAFFIIFLSIAFSAHAYILQNPVGHLESLLGNAGVGLPDSPGNALFNSAGLAFYADKNPNLSMSGSVINSQDSASKLYDQSYNSLTSRTLLGAGSYPVEKDYRAAAFYSFPQSSQFYGYADQTEAGARNRIAEVLTTESALGAIALAGLISTNTAWGFSIGVTWDEKESQKSVLSETTGQSSLTAAHFMNQSSFVTITPGFMWKVTPEYSLGLTATVSPFLLFSNGSSYTAKQESGSTTGEDIFDRFTPEAHGQRGAALGQSLILNKWKLLFDINYIQYDQILAEQAWQEAFGVSYHLASRGSMLGGLNYLETNSYSQYTVSGGAQVMYNNYDFVIGLNFQHVESRTQDIVLGGNTIGFLFSSAVTYDPGTD
jgi:hypothetical protein